MKLLIASIFVALSTQSFASVFKISGKDAKALMEAIIVPTTTTKNDYYTDKVTHDGYAFVCTKRTFHVGGMDYSCVVRADVTVTDEGIELVGINNEQPNQLGEVLLGITNQKLKVVLDTPQIRIAEATFGRIVLQLTTRIMCTSQSHIIRVFFRP